MDHHRHIHLSNSNSTHVGSDTRDTDHMMGFIKACLMFALVLFVFATVCAVISSWRQGVLARDWQWVKKGLHHVYHRLQKFTRRKN